MDVVVTVPKRLWAEWIAEGDLPGDPPTGREYIYYSDAAVRAEVFSGDRVYIVAYGKLRGYSLLVRKAGPPGELRWGLVRAGGAAAVTIDEPVRGFQGFRYRWWDRAIERPFPGWRMP